MLMLRRSPADRVQYGLRPLGVVPRERMLRRVALRNAADRLCVLLGRIAAGRRVLK